MVAFEERIAGCRRGEGHVGGFSVNFHSPETIRGKRSNPNFLGGCTGERSEHAVGGDGGRGGEEAGVRPQRLIRALGVCRMCRVGQALKKRQPAGDVPAESHGFRAMNAVEYIIHGPENREFHISDLLYVPKLLDSRNLVSYSPTSPLSSPTRRDVPL